MSHTAKVQSIYAAFGRGDVSAILEVMAPDVDWEYGGSPEIPWLQPRRGREGVGAFFRVAADMLEFRKFEVTNILENNGTVVALVDLQAIVKPTGKLITEIDEPQIWHFDAAGRVIKFRHRADTLQHLTACRA